MKKTKDKTVSLRKRLQQTKCTFQKSKGKTIFFGIFAIVMMTFFGCFSTVSKAPVLYNEFSKAIDTGMNFVQLNSVEYVGVRSKGGLMLVENDAPFDEGQKDLLISTFRKPSMLVSAGGFDTAFYIQEKEEYDTQFKQDQMAMPIGQLLAKDSLLSIDEHADMESLGLSFDRRLSSSSLCRLPTNENEIMISWLQADLFLKYGIVTEKESFLPSSIDQLIGKSINGLTIVGVYENKERDYIESLFPDVFSTEKKDRLQEIRNGVILSCHALTYTGETIDEKSTIYAFVTNAGQVASCLEYLDMRNAYGAGRVIESKNAFTHNGYAIDIFREYVREPGRYVVIVLLLFAACIFLAFGKDQVKLTKRLQPNLSNSDLLKTSLLQGFLMAVIISVPSWLLVALACLIFNSIVHAPLLSLSLVTSLEIFIFVLALLYLSIPFGFLGIRRDKKKAEKDELAKRERLTENI